MRLSPSYSLRESGIDWGRGRSSGMNGMGGQFPK